MTHNNEFATLVPELFGLTVPEDAEALAAVGEGFVIRPVDGEKFLRNGTRLVIKSKNSKFSEKSKGVSGDKLKAMKLSESGEVLFEDFTGYVNENRVAAVQSKIGEANWREIQMVAGLTFKDALEEFNKCHAFDLKTTLEDEWTTFNKAAMRVILETVRTYYKKGI